MTSISQRIEELRSKKGISRPAMAAALGFPKISIEKFETGRLTPNQEQQKKMAEYFGVSVDYICERGQNPEVAQDTDERDLLVMFRRTRGISPERREQIKEYIGSTIDMYLKAMGEDDD